MRKAKDGTHLPVSLSVQLKTIFREHLNGALGANKRRGARRGQNTPLSAWMLGAHKSSASRIDSVTGGTARFPYKQVGLGADVLAKRLGRRYGVTWVQQELLHGYVFSRYRGRYKGPTILPMGTVLDDQPMHETATFESMREIDRACLKLKINTSQLPLCALIDERVTNIILLIQLNEMLAWANTRRNAWK